MTLRVSASRPYAAEVQRVTSESVALRDEAQSVRERRIALEAAMRQERNRRLQHAAQRKSTLPRKEANGAPQEQPQAASLSPTPTAEAKHSSRSPSNGNELPRDLNEYRRELDSANGNKHTHHPHCYTSSHLNPADVHFYKAEGRVREYQRHAPSPPQPQTSSRHPSGRDENPTELLDVTPSPADGTSEQWTKSALLRMEANQRILRSIKAREEREAALRAARGGTRAASAPRRYGESAVVQPRAFTPGGAAPVVEPAPSGRTPSRLAHSFSSSLVPPPPHHYEWKFNPAQRSTAGALAAATVRSSPPRAQQRQSPPRKYFSGSPLRRYSSGSSPPNHITQNSPFKPSLKYSSASLHTSKVEPNPITSSVRRPATTTSSWTSLRDSWTSPSRGPVQSTYQPIAPQAAATAPSTPWESRRSWEGLTRPRSPSRFYEERKPLLLSRSSAPAGTAAAKGKAEVEVSPLTPIPVMGTAARSAGNSADRVEQPAAATNKSSLLEGFRMPDTILKRDDLFQGTA
ncbi:hypothetical protein ABB37_03586 [Leptomonas pyrrhocoris]|uniref:Uncharacterized protein n=1 Tax=Leptomonas pyrrhocoris TaxID=157538 RepID=A0A0M9G5G4_LEPPY|nr:hypothetical protein ABB37_03586 [Leptomonas pyrrhocoris]KPA82549.1 hypothetical protein ABB37_03586 [Leptomonas pyrrhocoris]|eukprot:XP_015660988.1 hypothetical protein ABB37_03586 [Leptomonas pyrrhocoris]